MKSQALFAIDEEMIDTFLHLLAEQLTLMLETKFSLPNFKNLLILLTTHSKALKRYEINHYSSFDELIKVLNYFTPLYTEHRSEESNFDDSLNEKKNYYSHFIIQILKAIYRAVKLPKSGNIEEFLAKQGSTIYF